MATWTDIAVGRTHAIISALTHWGRVTHIRVSKLSIIGSDNGLSPGRHQAIIWISAEIVFVRSTFQWNPQQNSPIFIQENAVENVVCEIAVIFSRPQCPKLRTKLLPNVPTLIKKKYILDMNGQL